MSYTKTAKYIASEILAINLFGSLQFILSQKCPILVSDDEDTGFVDSEMGGPDNENYDYELIGVTVHTGTADGGHYYSFIRDRLNKSESGQDKWYRRIIRYFVSCIMRKLALGHIQTV